MPEGEISPTETTFLSCLKCLIGILVFPCYTVTSSCNTILIARLPANSAHPYTADHFGTSLLGKGGSTRTDTKIRAATAVQGGTEWASGPIRAHWSHREVGLEDTGALTDRFRQRVNTDVYLEP